MLDNKERRVKARHDMTQFYQRKNDVSRREMRRGVMIISGDPNPNNSCRSSDNDIKDDTYVSSPQAHPPGKGLASASGSGLGEMMKLRKRLRKGADDDDGEEKEEVFDVEEINPPNYVDMGHLVFRAAKRQTSVPYSKKI
jgi:hypothetical protein